VGTDNRREIIECVGVGMCAVLVLMYVVLMCAASGYVARATSV
jgi:hypothetical protein